MYGKDYNYAESRLVDSIVRIAKTGEPVKVEHINQRTGEALVIFLKDKTSCEVPLDDLNLKPVPLGWCNTRMGATYLARIPRRRDWRQGIRAETCFSSVVAFRMIAFSDIAKCIRGEYPKFKDVIKNQNKQVMAWSRKWATDGKNVLFGQLGTVGTMEKGVPTLSEGFLFLKESLSASIT